VVGGSLFPLLPIPISGPEKNSDSVLVGYRISFDRLFAAMSLRKNQLTRDDILLGLQKLNERLAAEQVRGELCLYGGACMCVAFAARNSTKDVDAVFEPAALVRKAAFEIANDLHWDWNWLNDDVKGFLSRVRDDGIEVVDACEFSHLKVYRARADYLLAMKCLAARGGDDSPDLEDALLLCRDLGIARRDEIVKVVLRYFPDREPPERSDFFINELIDRLKGD
jgi:predicted nucleotidyltransferase